MVEFYYALGSSASNMVNLESGYALVANSLGGNEVPYVPPNKERLASGAVVRNGAINSPLRFSYATQANLKTFIETLFGDLTTNSVSGYAHAIDEFGDYSYYTLTIDRPYTDERQLVNKMWMQEITLPCFGWERQTVSKTGSATLSTDERYVLADTSGGAFTLTLPAANAVNANTLFTFVKTGGNNLSVAASGVDTISGGSSVTYIQDGRYDIVSDGSSAWSRVLNG